jgi:tRNA(fMet)-specific endonuclease VapC
MHLLDTNILTALHAGNQRIRDRLNQLDDPDIATTLITKIELLRGRMDFLLKATDGRTLLRAQSLLFQTETLLSEIDILPFDPMAIEQFERLIAERSLRKMGRADLQIASIALAKRATLVTRNIKDFRRIPSLKIINWFDS